MNTLEIKGARTRLGYTQRDMAEMLGLTEGSYQKRESGAVEFKHEEVIRLAEILHLTIRQVNDFIFDGKLPVA